MTIPFSTPPAPHSLPLMVVDPFADRIVSANAACEDLLGIARGRLTGERISALHPGQLPALVVFTEAVLTLGRYWTRDLVPRHATDAKLEIEYRGESLGEPGKGHAILLTLLDLAEQTRRAKDTAANRFQNSGIAEWQRMDRIFRDIERENRLILRAAGEGIYGVNAEDTHSGRGGGRGDRLPRCHPAPARRKGTSRRPAGK